MPRPATSEPLSAVDTAWLHMEDSANLMMVTGVLVFDDVQALARSVVGEWL